MIVNKLSKRMRQYKTLLDYARKAKETVYKIAKSIIFTGLALYVLAGCDGQRPTNDLKFEPSKLAKLVSQYGKSTSNSLCFKKEGFGNSLTVCGRGLEIQNGITFMAYYHDRAYDLNLEGCKENNIPVLVVGMKNDKLEVYGVDEHDEGVYDFLSINDGKRQIIIRRSDIVHKYSSIISKKLQTKLDEEIKNKTLIPKVEEDGLEKDVEQFFKKVNEFVKEK